MRCPLHVEVVTIVEWQLCSLTQELVEDHAVVDAPHARSVRAIKLSSLLAQVRGITGGNTEQEPRGGEIAIGLLARRIEIHEDDFVGVVVADDRAPGQTDERVASQAAVPARPLVFQPFHFRQGVAPTVALNDLQ